MNIDYDYYDIIVHDYLIPIRFLVSTIIKCEFHY